MITIQDWTTQNPLNCIGLFAGVCWNANTSNPDKNIKRALDCIRSGHGRVEELPDVYMIIEGYSAKCIRELYTHIGGSPTRMQASTRYIDYSKGFNYITPPSIENDPVKKKTWDMSMEFIGNQMKILKELGVPVEDLTNLLPLAYESKMIWKVNLRCLINFMNMRLCSRAYWEIRKLAKEIINSLSNYSEEWKIICETLFVPKCMSIGYCTEQKCCGRFKTKDEVIKHE